jgi:tetratricopeptide (TPR) repeat protein
MALVQGTAPETESDLRRAVALDPNDAEAWMWLGNCMSDQNRIGDALVAYHRATAIEPIFAPASGNLVRVLVDLGDDAGVAAEVRRVERTGDPVLLLKTRSAIARARYRLAEQVSILLKLRRDHPDQAGYVARRIRRPLLALGYVEQSVDPADVAAYRGKPGSPAEIRAAFGRPLDFWLDVDAPMVFGRLLPRHGRLDEYVGYFRAAFSSADAFVAAYHGRAESLITVLPNVAVILRTAGASDQGASLLQMGRPFLAQWLKNGPTTAEILLYSAEFDAADGRDDAALNELERAVAKGWLPDGSINASDLADEPCFEQLRGRPEFEAIRGRVLAKLEQERQTLASVPVGELAAASGLGGGTH